MSTKESKDTLLNVLEDLYKASNKKFSKQFWANWIDSLIKDAMKEERDQILELIQRERDIK